MDRSHVIAEVMRRTGVKLDATDPVVVVIEMNRIALEQSAEDLANRFSPLVADLVELPERIQASAQGLAVEVGVQGMQRVEQAQRQATESIAAAANLAQKLLAEQAARISAGLSRQAAAHVRTDPKPSPGRGQLVALLLTGAAIAVLAGAGGFAACQINAAMAPHHAGQQR